MKSSNTEAGRKLKYLWNSKKDDYEFLKKLESG